MMESKKMETTLRRWEPKKRWVKFEFGIKQNSSSFRAAATPTVRLHDIDILGMVISYLSDVSVATPLHWGAAEDAPQHLAACGVGVPGVGECSLNQWSKESSANGRSGQVRSLLVVHSDGTPDRFAIRMYCRNETKG